MTDYALAPSDDGTHVVLHRADCPDVRRQAAAGEPVMTLFDCQREPKESEIPRHSCLKGH